MQRKRARFGLLIAVVAASFACGTAGSGVPEGPRVEIQVAPLDLPGITNAVYTLTVRNESGETVWSRQLDSTGYGAGDGSLSYVGPCDADDDPSGDGAATNTVSLVLDALDTAAGPLTAGSDYANPAPSGAPVVQSAVCAADRDTAVGFDLTVARRAEQGFFDVAITFDDIFCSAKLDCENAAGDPLELLHDASGVWASTAVLAFACTAGPGSDTRLWLDPVTVTCTGGGPFTVDVAAGPGNLNPPFNDPLHDLFFQTAIYRGVEALASGATSWSKAYWNVAMGLNSEAFAALDSCTLTTTGTATHGPLTDGTTPPGQRWPMVVWNAPLISGGARVCARHGLDAGTEVATSYSDTSGHAFYATFARATGLASVVGPLPDGTSTLACADPIVAVGGETTCTLTPKQEGSVVETSASYFTLAASPAGTLSVLAPAFGDAFTFTFTAPSTSGLVTVDVGFGVSVELVVTDTPDATSSLACAPSPLDIDADATCTITPRRAGQPIYAAAADFAPTASAGSVGAITPAAGDSLSFTFTAPHTAQTVTVGDGLSTFDVAVVHATDAGTTSALAGYDCQTLLEQGVTTSGVYWVNPTGASAFQTYCEQERYGGGWTLLYNSVGVLNGGTRTFWSIPYASRFTHKGTAGIGTNFYAPTLYRDGREYLDAVEDLAGNDFEIFRATAGGITETTMAMVDPVFVSGLSNPWTSQFSAGWSASDRDLDLHATSNCAASYGGTQHYYACWYYSLAADADIPYADSEWGPHIYVNDGNPLGLTTDGSAYTRVNRISRFVKLCHGTGCTAATAGTSCQTLRAAGVTRNGVYWIDPSGSSPFRAYCDMTTSGGGWAVLHNSVGDPLGATLSFWTIPYAQRLTEKGTVGIGTNYYAPAHYTYGTEYMDVYEDMQRAVRVIFNASVAGINTTNMHFTSPALLSGDSGAYTCHIAAGWSSTDYDSDTYSGNCATSYSSVTQHYCACWNANLGSDADATGYVDGGWGPHVANTDTRFGLYSDGSTYSRVRRITRYVRY
ncbi:MAG: hypothetical protein EP329_27940 [Deltaproteobacteria bacterium]|nr:MAG: hypothetical protein EP329_27940 [Deltaproteobacteria bacterium]